MKLMTFYFLNTVVNSKQNWNLNDFQQSLFSRGANCEFSDRFKSNRKNQLLLPCNKVELGLQV